MFSFLLEVRRTNPTDPSYFAAYFIGIVLLFSATQSKVHVLRWVYWIYDQYPSLHQRKATKSWGEKLISFMRNLRRQPVCILVKTDEVCITSCSMGLKLTI